MQIVTIKINAYYKHIEEVRQWYKTEHMNYEAIKVEKSKWWVWNEVLETAKKSVATIQVPVILCHICPNVYWIFGGKIFLVYWLYHTQK